MNGTIDYAISLNGTLIQRECAKGITSSVECIHKMFCPQLPVYFINTGIIVLSVSFVLMVLSNLYLKHWYKKFPITFEDKRISEWIGDFNNESVRWEWRFRIREVINDMMFFYIFAVIYFNI